MCGIAGIVNLTSSRPVTGDELRQMNHAQAHRGPDADGVWSEESMTGLAHVRLSILDLRPESNQPFHLADDGLVVVFNGEIFNYLELRSELESRGHHFATRSDTEVLLKSYAEWGDECVTRFNGMWAFAIFDRRRRRLFCSRDRFGIKPFNYAEESGRFLFASEVKSILAVSLQSPRPNFTSLALVLKRSVGAQHEETCFEGIHRLPPAHNLVVEDGRVSVRRYWNYPTEGSGNSNRSEAAEELRALLSRAVALRLRSDVPVGISLSSGLDSSAIARLVRDHHEDSVQTFTSIYEHGHVTEFPAARELAVSLNMKAQAVPFEGSALLQSLSQIIGHLESPHASPAILPYWKITEAASRQVKVLLEGQGADELLAGYVNTCLASAVGDLLKSGRVAQAFRELSQVYRTAATESGYSSQGPLAYALIFARSLAPSWGHAAYRSFRGDEAVYQGPLGQSVAKAWLPAQASASLDLVTRTLVGQHSGGLVNLLHYGDAISMAHGLEARVPFLDYRLVEFAFGLAGEVKYRDGYGKAVLRDALRNDLPASIIEPRNKMGFITPIAQWLRERPDELIEPVLFGPSCRERGLFEPMAMRRIVSEHLSGRRNHCSQIFRWISTELWFQRFID